METLTPSETLEEEGCVISQLDPAQDPSDKTLKQVSGLFGLSENFSGSVSASEILVRENGVGADVGDKNVVMANGEAFYQIVSAGAGVELVEGGSSIGGAGSFDNVDCFGCGGIEKGSLVGEVVAEESHIKEVSFEPTFEGQSLPVSHGSEIKSGDLSVLRMCSTGYGNEDIGADKVTEGGLEVDGSQFNEVDSDKNVEVSGTGISLFVEVFGPLDGLVQGDDSKCLGESVLIKGNLNEESIYKENGVLLPHNGENTSAKVSEVHDPMLDVTTGYGTVESEAQKGNKVEGDTMPVYKSGELGESSVAQFEPKSFLGDVKNLAKDVSDPGMNECTIVQNRLSAFYCNLGHQQLPMDQLVPFPQGERDVVDAGINLALKFKKRKRSKGSSDRSDKSEYILLGKMGSSQSIESKVSSLENGDGGKNVMPEKGYESRERRKSKYLSYPYVNVIGSGVPKGSLTLEELEIEDLKAIPRAERSARSVDRHGKKLQNKFKKRINGRDLSGNTEIINASSAEVLSELRFTALDCCYPNKPKIDLVERYFLAYKKLMYRNIFFSETGEENSVEVHTQKGKGMEEVTVPIQRRRKKTEEKSSAGSKPKKTQKKEGVPQIQVMGDLLDLNQGNYGLPVEGPQVEPMRRKRKEGVASKRWKSKATESVSGLPNIEGSKAKLVPVLKNVQMMGLSSLQSINEPTKNGVIKEAASLDHMNTEQSSNQPKDPLKMSLLPPNDKPARKKRVRKEKASDLPDLNGKTAEGKPQLKRKRNKGRAGTVVSDFDYSKLQTNGEAQGTALLLKFSPELPLPSKEALVSAFCGFGELNESETQVLNDSFTAQVVFLDNSNARDAFLSLKSSPFGPSLVNYRFLDLSKLEADVNQQALQFGLTEKPKSPPKPKRTPVKPKMVPVKPKVAPPAKPPRGLKPQQLGEAPDLVSIRQNLEAMTTMLEHAGDNLPVEMRAKLENDIKGLLAKVSTS
ncbi:hypothetical protein LguiB_007782 [Lonicera macranthoides]